MSDFSERTKAFVSMVGFIRNASWLAGIVIGLVSAVGMMIYLNRTDTALLITTFFSLILATYTAMRAFAYRRRNKRLIAALHYVHRLTHDMRNAFDRKPATQNAPESTTGFAIKLPNLTNDPNDVTFEHVPYLRTILDNAAHCFREVTGKACYACLVMPHRDASNGEHLKSLLYCSDIDPERCSGSKPQRHGLAQVAYDANEPILFNDYEQELKKGNFSPNRSDWKKWYQSGFMTHFKVDGERFGVLVIDCRHRKAFRKSEANLVAAFADACGLIFNLCDEKQD